MRQTILLLFLLSPVTSPAESIIRERITCFQNGQQIIDINDRIRKFQELHNLKQIAELNLGQVTENIVRIYSVDTGNFVCVLKARE